VATHSSTIKIKATTQKVFDALTKPELVKLWQFGRVLATDWKVGSEIKFKAEYDRTVLEQWGTVLEMRPNELIKYNLFTPRPDLEDKQENYSLTSYVLTADNEQTKVEIIQEDNRPSGFTPTTLNPILASLKQVAETN
jgi:uncharacterized protein YndB with AHSA1/START domain